MAAASALAALVVAAAAFVFIQRHTPTAPQAASGPGGFIVYAAREGGSARLFVWDLQRNTVRPGPRVSRPVELVDAGASGKGWVGVTSMLENGDVRAQVLRFLGPDDLAQPLVTADFVAWGPRGDTVAFARQSPGRCGRLVVSYWRLVPTILEDQLDGPLCGRVVSLGRDGATTFLTIRKPAGSTIAYAGFHRTYRVLADHEMLDVSDVGDLLVVPGRATGGQSSARFFQGGTPVLLGSPAAPLRIGRVLAWSADSLVALVNGSAGGTEGLFEVDVGPGDRPRIPRFIGAIGARPWGAYAGDGTVFAAAGGSMWTSDGSRLHRATLPADAPTPAGPLVWLPPEAILPA